jgi:hypothetical protein
MSGLPVSDKKLRVNAFPVVRNPQPEFRFVVPEFHFDLARLRVPEGVAQRLGSNPVDFVAEDRMQIPWRAFHRYLKDGSILVGPVGRELFSDGPYGNREVIRLDRR